MGEIPALHNKTIVKTKQDGQDLLASSQNPSQGHIPNLK